MQCLSDMTLAADFGFGVASSRNSHAVLQYEDQVTDECYDDEEKYYDEEDNNVALHLCECMGGGWVCEAEEWKSCEAKI